MNKQQAAMEVRLVLLNYNMYIKQNSLEWAVEKICRYNKGHRFSGILQNIPIKKYFFIDMFCNRRHRLYYH